MLLTFSQEGNGMGVSVLLMFGKWLSMPPESRGVKFNRPLTANHYNHLAVSGY
jgi:hypothetical protein